jgi:hypothetical protein
MWHMLTSLSSFIHFYTMSSVPANMDACVSGFEGDCGACRGRGASYFDCEGLSLVSVVMVDLLQLCGWVMILMKRSSVLPQQHLVLWFELQNWTVCRCCCGSNGVTAVVVVIIVSVVFHLSSLCSVMKIHILCVRDCGM